MRTIIRTFLCGTVLAAAALAQRQVQVKADPAEISGRGLSGRRAPSFTLPDLAMKPYDILDYRGRWLLLAYINTATCPKCPELLRSLEGIKARLGAKVAVLAIVTPPENTATVSRFRAESKTKTPILFDSGQTAMWYFKATPQHPSIDSPHVFAISPQGMIVHDWNQPQTEAKAFAAEVEAVAGGGASAGRNPAKK